jgi:hypothetical protein
MESFFSCRRERLEPHASCTIAGTRKELDYLLQCSGITVVLLQTGNSPFFFVVHTYITIKTMNIASLFYFILFLGQIDTLNHRVHHDRIF